MKNKKFRGGFTLIELLVVVLIIGILAAVAVPQYKMAVIKSRVATILPFAKSIKEAKEVYYLQHNEYIRNIEALDVDVPAFCVREDAGYYACGDFNLDNNPSNVTVSYCPGHARWEDCYPVRDFSIVFTQQHLPENSVYPQAGSIYCAVRNGSELGKTICKKFPEFLYIEKE